MNASIRFLKIILAAVLLSGGIAACSSVESRNRQRDPSPSEWAQAVDPVEPKAGSARVVLKSPVSGLELDLNRLRELNDPMVFTWASLGDSTSYVIEIASDEAFNHLVVRRKIARNAFGYDGFERPGTFYWRVRSENGVPSETRRLVLR